MASRFKPYRKDYCQSQLFATNVFDLLPEDHDVSSIRNCSRLDMSEVEAQYSDRGQRAYAPRQIVSILIYAYSRGVFSSRQIEQRCREDRCRGEELPELPGVERFPEGPRRVLPGLLPVQLALALGLVSLGQSLDGSARTARSTRR